MDDVPHARVPLGQLALREAADHVTDGDTYWLETMPACLHWFPGITPAAYWELTVDEHAALVRFVEAASGT